MKRQVSQGTARKCPWVIERRHQVAGRIFLWFALPTSGFSCERVLIPKLPAAPFSSSNPNSEAHLVESSPGIDQWSPWQHESLEAFELTKRASYGKQTKDHSQVVAELRATWTSHTWDKATISSNSIQEAKTGFSRDLVFFCFFFLNKRNEEVAPHRCMYMSVVFYGNN